MISSFWFVTAFCIHFNVCFICTVYLRACEANCYQKASNTVFTRIYCAPFSTEFSFCSRSMFVNQNACISKWAFPWEIMATQDNSFHNPLVCPELSCRGWQSKAALLMLVARAIVPSHFTFCNWNWGGIAGNAVLNLQGTACKLSKDFLSLLDLQNTYNPGHL